MTPYRIIDEQDADLRRRPPWDPRGLFLISILSLPVGTILFTLNWGRLAHPEKRFITLLLGFGALVVPFSVGVLAMAQGWPRENLHLLRAICRVGFAIYQMHSQTPLFAAVMRHRRQPAPAWQLWAIGLACVGLSLLTLTLLRP